MTDYVGSNPWPAHPHTHPTSDVVGLVTSIEHLRKEIEIIRQACTIALLAIALLVMAFLASVILTY